MLLFPVLDFYLLELYTHNPFEDIKPSIQFMNIFFFEMLMLLFFALFGSLKKALRFQTVFFMIIGLADYYVLEFRSAPIMPWDIFSFGTAMSVADNFNYTPSRRAVLVFIGFLLLIFAERVVTLKIKASDEAVQKYTRLRMIIPITRVAAVLAFAGIICGFTNTLWQAETISKYGMYDKLFTPTVVTKRNGVSVAFLMELQYVSVDKPEGYSADAAEKILASYEISDEESIQRTPNIIVVMNEAFSDPAVLGDFETNVDYMPFVHSILDGEVENTTSGWLNVSVLGGNTANTEFEFLTGNSMAFLPQGSIPYQQYVKSEIYSLASDLSELGYRTVATHPYNSTGWYRNTVYPLLGFDEMYFIRDYSSPEKIRSYVSDRACYDKIIELYEESADDKPIFVFNVTMQNHSSYTEEFDNFTPDVEVANSSSKSLNNYLSLIKISDESIEYLINYFSSIDDDTIIVFFGDHQPANSVVSSIWKLNGKDGNDLSDEDTANRYKVPFFIWSNFESDTVTDVETSANYLAAKLQEIAGLPLYDYAEFLRELSESYPVITALRTVNADGESMETQEITNNLSDYSDLNDYAILQYYSIFGKD